MERYYILGIEPLTTVCIIWCCKHCQPGVGVYGYAADNFIIRNSVFKTSLDVFLKSASASLNNASFVGMPIDIVLNEMKDEIIEISVPIEDALKGGEK